MKPTYTPPLCPFLISKSVINFCKPTHPPIHDCDAVGGAFYYLVLRMQNPCRRQAIITLGANATTCRRQTIYILVSIHSPYLRLLIVGAAEGGEREGVLV